MALLWLVTASGFLLGVAAIALGLVGWSQGASAAAGLGVAAVGVVFVLCALWYLRLLLTHRAAASEHQAAQREFDAAVEQTRARHDEGER